MCQKSTKISSRRKFEIEKLQNYTVANIACFTVIDSSHHACILTIYSRTSPSIYISYAVDCSHFFIHLKDSKIIITEIMQLLNDIYEVGQGSV